MDEPLSFKSRAQPRDCSDAQLAELAQRLGALEQTVDTLKSRMVRSAPSGRWWVESAGRFKDDPLFD